jgi:hypothetical protein
VRTPGKEQIRPAPMTHTFSPRVVPGIAGNFK